jgi:cytochrome c-type biogenesis protein CcsB
MVPALICYALSACAFASDSTLKRTRLLGPAVLMLGAGAVFQALDLAMRGVAAGNIPVSNFTQSLSFLAWLTALVGLVLIVRLRVSAIGAFLAPAVTLVAGASYLMTGGGHFVLPEPLRSVWLPIHVTLAFLGYALFVLAASVSIVYLVHESRLKSKRPVSAPGNTVPSLEKLDRINFRLLVFGFVLLSLAIVSGAIWAEATWGRFWTWEPKESWALVLWILYAALLQSRLTVGWRGRRAAALTIAVFGVLVGSYLGVNLIAPGKHGGGFG